MECRQGFVAVAHAIGRQANPWSTEASTAASEAEKPQVGLIQWVMITTGKDGEEKSDECCLGMKFHTYYDTYISPMYIAHM